MRAAAVRLLLCVAVGAAAVPLELRSDETVEYELAPSDKWQWFMLRTNNVQGVVAGLVVQRGNNDNFPRMGFVATSSTGPLPPGSISGADFDPSTYTFATPSGATKYFWDSPSTPRPTTDWRVLTVGFDGAAPAESPLDVHIPLNNVLIGVRCLDAFGCRYSLPATLLPFVLADYMTVVVEFDCLEYTDCDYDADGFTEDDGELHPWSTWPTVLRGVNNNIHNIRFINQDLRCSKFYKPIWEILAH